MKRRPTNKRSTPQERRAFAWKRVKEWAPRVAIVEELQARFGVSQSVAYEDVQGLFEELAANRALSRRAEAEALLIQIDEQIQRVRYCDDTESDKARALVRLWDLRARLVAAYRDPQRIAVLFAEAKKLTGFSDDLLEAMIEDEQKLLTSVVVDAKSEG